MKLFKKILLLSLTCLTFFTVGAISACKDNGDEGNGSEIVEPVDYVYKVRTQSEGGFGLKNVNVTLYDGDTKIVAVNTNSMGNAFFTDEHIEQTGEYRIELSNVPAGWSVKDESVTYQTSNISGTNVNINFTASLITDEETPQTKLYRLGDVMYDFTMKDSAGDSYTLSELLAEKKMVMLNFWATYCGPCEAEFPVMQRAYELYQSEIEILAVTSYYLDDQSVVTAYKRSHSLTFPMSGVPDSAVITSHFDTSAGVPMTAIIDRYGVVAYMHTGNMLALTDFTSLFDKFVGDNYVQTVIDSNAEGGEGGGSGGTVEQIKPTVSEPDLSDVANAFSGNSTAFTYSWEKDDYAWPWTIGTKDGEKYLQASNKQIEGSYAALNIEFTAAANSVLTFDTYVSSELNADYLYVLVDGVIIHALSGAKTNDSWDTCYAYVFETMHAGKHTLSLVYQKDATVSGDDDVFVKNLRFIDKTALNQVNNLSLNILRNAAYGWNKPTELAADESKKTKFASYATVKLGQEGYYHVVDDANATVDITKDPILFADIMNPTLWNMYDLWQLAYNGLTVYEGFDLEEAIEDFAWAANESRNGLVPVTEDLKALLDMVAQIEVLGEGYDKDYRTSNYYDEDYHVAYHANEWLELCQYYDHYGNTPQIEDPTRGITYDGAIEVTEGTNSINCFKSMVPLGVKHKFTPTKSGVYHFYSIVDPEYFDTAASYNPQMWLVAPDKSTHLAHSDDFLRSKTGNPENFDITYYLEAGKTYYCLFAFFLNETGKFDMNIDYLGSYAAVMTNAAIGPYSYNPVTSDTYVPSTTRIAYDEATDTYRVTDENGVFLGDIYEGLDDAVYLDLTGATYLFPSQSLGSFVETADNYAENKRLFYLEDGNGSYKDYTDDMRKYLFFAYRNAGDTHGMAKVDKNLMEIMLKLTKAYDGFGGIKNSWQMMCYYHKPIGVQEVQA